MPLINKTLLMSDAKYFNDSDAINALMDSQIPVNKELAEAELKSIKRSLEKAGITITQVDSPINCQDGVYTANWGLVKDGKILMSRLPNKRKPEEDYALKIAKNLGLQPIILPEIVECFSGQGDALPCGEIVFTQSPYRTSHTAHKYIQELLGYEKVLSLQTKPARWYKFGPRKINKLTGWLDSPTYDIDLAIAILKWPSNDQKGLIAYCPEVFTRKSRNLLNSLDNIVKIEVSKNETLKDFALNLVSTGETVIMNNGAPNFCRQLKDHGLDIIQLHLPELKKGGGSIRCSTLTLDN